MKEQKQKVTEEDSAKVRRKGLFEKSCLKHCIFDMTKVIFDFYIAVRGTLVLFCQTMNADLSGTKAEKPIRWGGDGDNLLIDTISTA